jgi:hypothetical protein
MPIYILIAIDGTGSKEWFNIKKKNSWTWRFYEDFKTDAANKKFRHGPDSAGMNVTDILDDVQVWLNRRMADIKVAYLATQPPYKPPPLKKIEGKSPNLLGISELGRESLLNLIAKDAYEQNLFNKFIREQIEFCLVGHSRGAAMVADFAAKLPKRACFMGLYDSVDRSTQITGGKIRNVGLTYHAMRDPSTHSRDTFGNTNLTSDGSYVAKRFKTSHGGIGGDYNPSNSDLTGDYSGSKKYYQDPKDCISMGGAVVNSINLYRNSHWGENNPQEALRRYEQFLSESKNADAFIRQGAKLAGIPLG